MAAHHVKFALISVFIDIQSSNLFVFLVKIMAKVRLVLLNVVIPSVRVGAHVDYGLITLLLIFCSFFVFLVCLPEILHMQFNR